MIFINVEDFYEKAAACSFMTRQEDGCGTYQK